jgi:hypothetical protein
MAITKNSLYDYVREVILYTVTTLVLLGVAASVYIQHSGFLVLHNMDSTQHSEMISTIRNLNSDEYHYVLCQRINKLDVLNNIPVTDCLKSEHNSDINNNNKE